MATIVQCDCGAEYKRTETKFLVPHTGHASCLGWKARTFPHLSWSNVQTESPHEPVPKAVGPPTEAASKESIMGKRSTIPTMDAETAALTVSASNQQTAFAKHQSWPMVKPVLLAALVCAAPVSRSSAQDAKVSVDMMGIGGMSCVIGSLLKHFDWREQS